MKSDLNTQETAGAVISNLRIADRNLGSIFYGHTNPMEYKKKLEDALESLKRAAQLIENILA